MSETTIDPVPTVADAPDSPVAEEQNQPVEPAAETGPDLAAEVAKWKALSKKNELRAKENADKAKAFDEHEEANKSELQRLLDRAETAEKAAAQALVDKTRSDVAKETGVPVELLHGQTEEEMRSAAGVALAYKAANKPPLAPPANIVTSDGKPTKVDQIRSRDDLKSMTPQQILAAEKAGRLDELMGKPT